MNYRELKFERGKKDGMDGGPPSEVTEDYLKGFEHGKALRKERLSNEALLGWNFVTSVDDASAL